MVKDALRARPQIDKYLNEYQKDFFTDVDWRRLEQLQLSLCRFDEITKTVSEKKALMRFAVSIYWDLHELFDAVVDRTGIYADLDPDIAAAFESARSKYDKHYRLMDENNLYYTALVLDPRIKGQLLVKELGHGGQLILDNIRSSLWEMYGKTGKSVANSAHLQDNSCQEAWGVERRDCLRGCRQTTAVHLQIWTYTLTTKWSLLNGSVTKNGYSIGGD